MWILRLFFVMCVSCEVSCFHAECTHSALGRCEELIIGPILPFQQRPRERLACLLKVMQYDNIQRPGIYNEIFGSRAWPVDALGTCFVLILWSFNFFLRILPFHRIPEYCIFQKNYTYANLQNNSSLTLINSCNFPRDSLLLGRLCLSILMNCFGFIYLKIFEHKIC